MVLGGKGFIGKNLLNDLKEKYLCRCGTRKNKKLNKSKSFDFLINASGNSDKRLAENKPLIDFKKTVYSTLESILRYKYQHYILISSCEVYPSLSKKKATKEKATLPLTQTKYGFHKSLAENLVKKYCPRYTILRLSTPIGPGLKKGPIFDLFFRRIIWVSSKSRFHVLHTKYISHFIHSLIQAGISRDTFNVVSQNSISIERIIQMVNLTKPKECANKIISHSIDSSKAEKIMNLPSSEKCILELQKTKAK